LLYLNYGTGKKKQKEKNMKKLIPLRAQWIETLFAVAGSGYVYETDGFWATFLPGRNVVVVEAETLNKKQQIKKVCQIADFHESVGKFPGRFDPGCCGILGRGIEGFDAARQIPGVVVENIDRR
jgi:hypothetical protein